MRETSVSVPIISAQGRIALHMVYVSTAVIAAAAPASPSVFSRFSQMLIWRQMAQSSPEQS